MTFPRNIIRDRNYNYFVAIFEKGTKNLIRLSGFQAYPNEDHVGYTVDTLLPNTDINTIDVSVYNRRTLHAGIGV